MAGKKYKSIIHYIQASTQTFEERKLGVVDSLILSQVSYFKLDGIVAGMNFFTKGILIKDLFQRRYFHQMFDKVRDWKQNEELLRALASSPRFRDVKMKYYVNDTDEQEEKQFSAVTFFITKKEVYVAYRGTDATAIGWKEDFNMAFMDSIPAQREALSYLNTIAKWTMKRLILGGHSKGGNLAIYAATKCKPRIQKRIMTIYSHDGPGFQSEFFEQPQYKAISGRIHKTVPESSLVGMLLESQGRYYVVESAESGGLMQHNPYSWIVKNHDFVYLEQVSSKSKHMDQVLHQWINDMSLQERKQFANTIYELFSANEGLALASKISVKDVIELIITAKDMKPETRNNLIDTIKKLVGLYLVGEDSHFYKW